MGNSFGWALQYRMKLTFPKICVVYVVPEIRSFLSAHPFERSTTGTGLAPLVDATTAVVVVVAVVVTVEHVPFVACSGLALSALLARLAISPVAVARPTTAAARSATRIDRMRIVLLRDPSPSPCAERVE
jgi:hypothetical protein